jgi:HD-GYP domain-containing protein (c-di-GMP phosphodiesterase class II)
MADYVLMAAESFEQHQDLEYTTIQLVQLGNEHPLRYIQKAIIIAEELGYSLEDIEKLALLAQVYQVPESTLEAP